MAKQFEDKALNSDSRASLVRHTRYFSCRLDSGCGLVLVIGHFTLAFLEMEVGRRRSLCANLGLARRC